MSQWINLVVDFILIAVVGVGVAQATSLIRQLRDLRSSRADMDRFVRDFNGAVMRAEAGIKALRAAARESGDDLEKLVEKAVMVRDELHFIVESADGVAERLSSKAASAINANRSPQDKAQEAGKSVTFSESVTTKPETVRPETPPPSRAEQELMQALKKLS